MMRKLLYVMPKTGFSAFQWEPLAAGYLHAWIKAHGWEGEAQFMSALKRWDATDDEILRAGATSDGIAMYATSPQFKHATQLARSIKEENPSVRIAIGGPHASAVPEDVASLTLPNGKVLFDGICVGEGERFWEAFIKEEPMQQITRFDFIADVNEIPFPDRSIMDMPRQLRITEELDGKRIASLFGSRACPAKCTFCSSRIVWGRNTRERTAKNILDELEELISNYQINAYRFADDIFAFSTFTGASKCRDYAQEAMRRGLAHIPFECNLRGNISEQDLEWLAKAGCEQVNIGVESGSDKILKEMKKGVGKDQMRRSFKKCRDLGIRTRSYIILGLPGEDTTTIKETWDFLEELSPGVCGFTQAAGFPGTDYWKPEYRDVDWSLVDEYASGPMLTSSLTRQELEYWQRELSRRWKDRLSHHAKQRAAELEAMVLPTPTSSGDAS